MLDVLWSLRARRLTNPEKQKNETREEREKLEKKNEREKRAKEQPIDRTSKRKKSKKKKRQKFPLNREKKITSIRHNILAQFKYIYKKRKEWARV